MIPDECCNTCVSHPRWKSRIHASIYKRQSTAPVVNKEQFLYWTVGTGPRVGAILAQYSPSPETKCRLTTDFGAMSVLNQYRFQCWHGAEVQYRASTNGQLPEKLPFVAAPVVGRAYASTMPVLQILLRYWHVTKLVVNSHLGYYFLQHCTGSSQLRIEKCAQNGRFLMTFKTFFGTQSVNFLYSIGKMCSYA